VTVLDIANAKIQYYGISKYKIVSKWYELYKKETAFY